MNNIVLLCAKAIINHPQATNGAVEIVVVFLPSHLDIIPPMGEKITPDKVEIAANIDNSSSFNFTSMFDSFCSSGNAFVGYPIKVPKLKNTMETTFAPNIYKGLIFEHDYYVLLRNELDKA